MEDCCITAAMYVAAALQPWRLLQLCSNCGLLQQWYIGSFLQNSSSCNIWTYNNKHIKVLFCVLPSGNKHVFLLIVTFKAWIDKVWWNIVTHFLRHMWKWRTLNLILIEPFQASQHRNIVAWIQGFVNNVWMHGSRNVVAIQGCCDNAKWKVATTKMEGCYNIVVVGICCKIYPTCDCNNIEALGIFCYIEDYHGKELNYM